MSDFINMHIDLKDFVELARLYKFNKDFSVEDVSTIEKKDKFIKRMIYLGYVKWKTDCSNKNCHFIPIDIQEKIKHNIKIIKTFI